MVPFAGDSAVDSAGEFVAESFVADEVIDPVHRTDSRELAAASKFGVLGITQSLAKELAPTGMTVNAFCPGILTTDMGSYNNEAWDKPPGDYKLGELTTERVNDIPMTRAGTGEDVAGRVALLASDDAST